MKIKSCVFLLVFGLLALPLFSGGGGAGAAGEVPTIRYFIRDDARTTWSMDTHWIQVIAEKMGGVNFDIIAVPGGEATAKFNTFIAGGDMPGSDQGRSHLRHDDGVRAQGTLLSCKHQV